jgi:hypothetical protein
MNPELLNSSAGCGLDLRTTGYLQLTINLPKDQFPAFGQIPPAAVKFRLWGQQPSPSLVMITSETVPSTGQQTKVLSLPIYQGKVSILIYLRSTDYLIAGALLSTFKSGEGRRTLPSYTITRDYSNQCSWIVFDDVRQLDPKAEFPYVLLIQKVGQDDQGVPVTAYIDPAIINDVLDE